MGSLSLRPGDLLHPKDGFVNRFQKFSFFPSCYSSFGASDSYPGGTTSR